MWTSDTLIYSWSERKSNVDYSSFLSSVKQSIIHDRIPTMPAVETEIVGLMFYHNDLIQGDLILLFQITLINVW